MSVFSVPDLLRARLSEWPRGGRMQAGWPLWNGAKQRLERMRRRGGSRLQVLTLELREEFYGEAG